jgi:hypothetical protein
MVCYTWISAIFLALAQHAVPVPLSDSPSAKSTQLSDAPSSTPMSSTPVFKAKSTAPLSSTPLSSTRLSHAVVALDQPKPAPPVVTRPFHVGRADYAIFSPSSISVSVSTSAISIPSGLPFSFLFGDLSSTSAIPLASGW